jgi:ubiquinone/menaquinone biosynthesis C-methylase UbiE
MNVVISNVDERTAPGVFAPYAWSYQNAEQLGWPDGSFDYVVAHAMLHHCHSPHRAFLEMYRVSRRAALAIEARDSALMRLFERAHLAQVYEPTAVFYNDGRYGGVNNSEIPNFIYRWTEREVEKMVHSYAPHVRSRIRYFYGHAQPGTTELESDGAHKQRLIRALHPVYRVFAALFPRQQNLFAFLVEKPTGAEDLHPWLEGALDRPRFNREWARARYR